MTINPERLSVLLSVLGAAGNLLYLGFILRQPTRSALDRRIIFLLLCLTGMFVDRIIFPLVGTGVVHTLTMLPATGIPLATTLFMEGLRRRHLPLPLKVGVALGTVISVTLDLVLVHDKREFSSFFSTFTVITLAVIAGWLVFRPRADLSPAENRLVDAISAACALGVPFAITDFEWRPDLVPYQLGGIGTLIFVYACIRLTMDRERRRTVALDFARAVLHALVVAAGFVFFVPAAAATIFVAVALCAFAFVLLFSIMARLRDLRVRDAGGGTFDHWLLRADTSSMESFVASLTDLPWAERPLVLREGDLRAYDAAAITRFFGSEPTVWRRAELGRAVAEADPARLDGAEQLLDLLVSRDMTHVALLEADPPVLLCLKLPDLAGQQVVTLELAVLQRVARLVAARSRDGATPNGTVP